MDAFHDFYKDLAEMERDACSNGLANTGWKDSFKANFGRSVGTFYQEFADFMTWNKSRKVGYSFEPRPVRPIIKAVTSLVLKPMS